ncbi:hypothetical protein M404DRAFT_996804 [Pisolithus tinctorius Marx 270]|uniref:Uncharacterized protein n=1 Tax=Pisolithus tinctorius Marx 270 TaxID=870435 RepID=A0A0C3P6X4_PISTI|nr:hypothetical protein M404DRAFT_996804 [Pisolithus tinctorius Marx 270]
MRATARPRSPFVGDPNYTDPAGLERADKDSTHTFFSDCPIPCSSTSNSSDTVAIITCEFNFLLLDSGDFQNGRSSSTASFHWLAFDGCYLQRTG